jgi:uncharacterized protein
MNIDLIRLKNGVDEYIDINTTYSFPKEMLKGTDVESLNDVKLKGQITVSNIGEYKLLLHVEGVMIIPCAVTLKPVSIPLNIEIDEVLNEITEENEEIVQNIENTIDILPIIWENILVEIPTRVVSPEADNVKLEGEGWRLRREDDPEEKNLELEKLKDLLQ